MPYVWTKNIRLHPGQGLLCIVTQLRFHNDTWAIMSSQCGCFFKYYICVCVCSCACHSTWVTKGHLWESAFSFHHQIRTSDPCHWPTSNHLSQRKSKKTVQMDDRQTPEPTIKFLTSGDQLLLLENFIECTFIIFPLTPSRSTPIH